MEFLSPKSISDASRTGMPYLPKEPITPRGTEFTRLDGLPTVGSTSPYKGDMEGNIKMEFGGTDKLKARKIKTAALGPLGDGPSKAPKEDRAPAPIATNKSISMHYKKAEEVADERIERLARLPTDHPDMDLNRALVNTIPAPSPIETRFRPREGRTLPSSFSASNLLTPGTGFPSPVTGHSGTFGGTHGGFGQSYGVVAPSITTFPATYTLPAKVTASGRDGSLTSTHILKVEGGDYMKTGQFSDKVSRRRAFHMLPSSGYAAALMHGVALAKQQFAEMSDDAKKDIMYGEGEMPRGITSKRMEEQRRAKRNDSGRPSSGNTSNRSNGASRRPPSRGTLLTPIAASSATPKPKSVRHSSPATAGSHTLTRGASTNKLSVTAAGPTPTAKRTAGANMFAGGYVPTSGGVGINDGAGGVITMEDKANALAAYQNKLAATTGYGSRSYKGLAALNASGDGWGMTGASGVGTGGVSATGDVGDTQEPEKQELPEAYAEILSGGNRKKNKSRSRNRPKAHELDGSLQPSMLMSMGSSLSLGDGESEAASPGRVPPPAMPTMDLVMQSWPHKTPARAPPAVPSPPPKLKGTLPLEHGAYVSWRHGEDVNVIPDEGVMTSSPGKRSPGMNESFTTSLRGPGGVVSSPGGPAAPDSPLRPRSQGHLNTTNAGPAAVSRRNLAPPSTVSPLPTMGGGGQPFAVAEMPSFEVSNDVADNAAQAPTAGKQPPGKPTPPYIDDDPAANKRYEAYAGSTRILMEDPYNSSPAAPDGPLKPKAASATYTAHDNGMPKHLAARLDAVDLKVPAAQREFVPVSKDLKPPQYAADGMPLRLQAELDEMKRQEEAALQAKRDAMAAEIKAKKPYLLQRDIDDLVKRAEKQGWQYAVTDGEGKKVTVVAGAAPVATTAAGGASRVTIADGARSSALQDGTTRSSVSSTAAATGTSKANPLIRGVLSSPVVARVGGKPKPVVNKVMGKSARAAVFIQRIIRGFLTRRNVFLLNVAARVIQKWYRQLIAKRELRRDIAALQAIGRGARIRKALEDAKKQLAAQEEERQKQKLFEKRVKYSKMSAAKKERFRQIRMWKKTEVARLIQQWWHYILKQRGYYEAVKLAQAEWRFRAAAHIQSVFRGYCVRRDLKWKRYYCIKIQRLFRKWSKRRALMLRVFTLAQRKRYKNVIQIQSLTRGWLVRKRFWVYVELRWEAEKRRLRAEARHILNVCNEARRTISDYFQSSRGKKQLAAEGNMLRARMQVRKRERVARIKGALTDWGKSDKKKRKGEPEEDYGLPPGIDLDFLRSDRFEDNVEREKRSQYEAFDRYYKSKQGVGVGTWGAFGGSGVVIPAQRLLWEGESGVPYQELGPAPVKPQGDGLDHPDHVFDLAFGDSLKSEVFGHEDHTKAITYGSNYGPGGKRNPFSHKGKGGKGEHGPSFDAAVPPTIRARTLAEVEEEIMLRDTFELFDVEQRGGLDVDLLRLLMASLDIAMTDEEARDAMKSMDVDGNGYVEVSEFLGFFKRKASEIAELETRLGVGYKLNRLRNKLMGQNKMGQVFQMNHVYVALAKRGILGSEFKRVGETARAEFRKVYPPPLCCQDCSETFVLSAELVRHRKFGCAAERTRERLLAEEERQQRILQAALGKRLREVVRLKPGEVFGEEKEAGEDEDEDEYSDYSEEPPAPPPKAASGSRRK